MQSVRASHTGFETELMELRECSEQILVPKTLRGKVMEVAHDSIFAGHVGTKKTKDRIQTNFYWPGMQGNVTSFCRLYVACQKKNGKRSVPRVPRGDMPLIDMPFRRVAVDLVGLNFTCKREGTSIYTDLGRLCDLIL